MLIDMRVIRRQELNVPGLVEKIQAAMDASDQAITTICGKAGFSYQYWRSIARAKNPSISEDKVRKLEEVLGVDFGVTFED
jgi:hypothetical protein